MPSAASPLQTTVELAPLARLATISPASINHEARTVDVTFSTGVAVKRYDWRTGEYFLEKLSLDPKHVRLERLNAGAPVLDTHTGYSLSSQMGVVEAASVDGKRGKASLRMSQRPEVDGAWLDIETKIVRNVSVGYDVYTYQETPAKDNKLPVRLAIDWEPYEISFVPMPADIHAQTRDGKAPERTHTAVVTTVEDPPLTRTEESSMKPTTPSETLVEPDPIDPGAPIPAARAAVVPQPTEADRGASSERARITGIMLACRSCNLPSEFMQRLIDDGTPLVDAQTAALTEQMNRGGDRLPNGGQRPSEPRQRGIDVALGDDPRITIRAGIENALLHRLAPGFFKLEEIGRNYRGMTMLGVAETYLRASGLRTTNLSKMEIAGLALGLSQRAGFHSTSDYADLLADVANKTLRRAYEEQPQTWAPITRQTTAPDFKTINRVQLGDAPDLLKVNEHAEFTRGTIGEGKETYRLATYGRVFAITRQALVNDDTDAFSRVPMMFGRKARILENDLVWEQITSNPLMGDGNALFSAAHSNVAATVAELATISVASLGVGREKMRMQTSIDGDLMNLGARYLLVPPSLETLADQFVTVITPNQPANTNPFMGRLQVISEPRLQAVSASAWYLASEASAIDILEIAYLEGQIGPMVESRIGFDVDGLEIKARLDVAAKVIDWRGLYLNEGVGAS